MAYKAGTSVTEESAGTWLQRELSARRNHVLTHDPMAEHTSTMEEVLGCPTVIVCTDWPEYRALKFSKGTLVIDPYGITAKQEKESVPAQYDLSSTEGTIFSYTGQPQDAPGCVIGKVDG
jgi:UDP-N-acetyl-D-mannosaminuronate dehydrogenase